MKSTDVWDGLQGAIEEATATCNERIQELKQKDATAKAARMALSAARGGGRAAQAAGRGSARGNSAGRGRGRTPMHQGGPLISLAGNLQGENNIGWPQALSGYMPAYPYRPPRMLRQSPQIYALPKPSPPRISTRLPEMRP